MDITRTHWDTEARQDLKCVHVDDSKLGEMSKSYLNAGSLAGAPGERQGLRHEGLCDTVPERKNSAFVVAAASVDVTVFVVAVVIMVLVIVVVVVTFFAVAFALSWLFIEGLEELAFAMGMIKPTECHQIVLKPFDHTCSSCGGDWGIPTDLITIPTI